MISFPLTQVARICSTSVEDTSLGFQGISTDTRTLQPGNLFIALKGKNYDGHLFVEEARQKGAVAAVVEYQTASALLQMVVPDTVKAFGALAQAWRQQFKLPIVGLTGSNGKTTLKNMIATILRAACAHQEGAVLSTEANFNNHIGVPALLTQLNATHRYAVIEMGMNHFGEIAHLTQMVCPTVAIINNAAPAHLEGVADLAGVAKAKGEIFLGLAPQGTAILNADDAYFSYWKTLIGEREFIAFGLQEKAAVSATLHPTQDPLKQHVTITTPNGSMDVNLPLLGKHNVMNALAATAACIALNIDLHYIREGLENVAPARGRLQLYSFAQDIRLIDDTYNANPSSVQAAVKVLAAFTGNKILILGEMAEQGENTAAIHATMGKAIREAGIDLLFTYGELCKPLSKNFGSNAYHFNDQQALVTAVKQYVKPYSTVLVKGSRYMKMEAIVSAMKEVLQYDD